MGFKKVYYALQEIFPEEKLYIVERSCHLKQIDSRVLRAVAIEHCKDPDAAVEVVFTEVIPILADRARPLSAPSLKSGAVAKPSQASSNEYKIDLLSNNAICGQGQSFLDTERHQPCNNVGQHNVLDGSISGNLLSFETGESSLRVVPDVSSNVTSYKQNLEVAGQSYSSDKCESSGTVEHTTEVNEECAGNEDSGDKCEFFQSLETAASNLHEECEAVLLEHINVPVVEINGLVSHEFSSTSSKHTLNEQSSYFDSLNHVSSSNIQACDSSAELVVDSGMENVDPEETGLSSFINDVSDKNLIGEMHDVDMGSISNFIVTRSGRICSIDLLEDIIAEARSNKSNMFAAMESLISLMREVELREKAAEKAKEEASIGALDILRRVDDLKEMLRHAKEANDMHAGEVYGEKAILATEVKELQSRLLSLADEKDKSLAVLDEMRQTLELRLNVAEREMEAAEQDKLQKEELARKALAEQECIMEEVVHESNVLKQEAEENAKLREFLIDHGRVVDMLQGEISVICQDVRLLKERFDNNVPLSKSLSSNQTSCILASSSSSLKSIVPDLADDQTNSSDEQQKMDFIFPVSADETGNDSKAVMDDEWEIFDKPDLCM